MKIILMILLCLSFTSINKAHSRPIISGISTNQINIDTKFTGAEVLLFGAKGNAGNIIVVIRGPKKDYVVSKKDKLLGVWYNKDRTLFKDSHSYYSFFSSNENEVGDERILSKLEIGKDRIQFDIEENKNVPESEFKVEFVYNMENKNLYLSHPESIEFLDETLFKVMLRFPKNISQGTYVVDIYLIDDSELSSFQSIPIYVNQVGLSSDINQFAHNNSVLYAIVAILIAVSAGFFANFVFVKLFNK
jgi:uncharacterized protein (TIGR02186 family)